VEFNPRLLDAPLQTHDPVAYMAARSQAESALAAQRAGLDVGERVRRWLLTTLPHQPSLQETAEQLKMTERSLRRQLNALGLSYAELSQQCQQLIAKHLLADRALPIKQVADQLGFSSVTSFHRAFRRWTDMTPLAWRARDGGETLREDPVVPSQ
jgi:AraC-like DNA-binding protein